MRPLLHCFVLASLGACDKEAVPSAASPASTSPNQAPATVAHARPSPPASDARAMPEDDTLVDVQDYLPEAILDIRYATVNNFAGEAVYPRATCKLRYRVVQDLQNVQQAAKADNLRLLIWDCYRPFAVQERFWKLKPDARYVARPVRDAEGRPVRGSKHNHGAAIDLSLARADGTPLAMPTDYDDFSERAHRGAAGVDPIASKNALHLETLMEAAGFVGMPTEWWHFDHQSWQRYSLGEEAL